MKAAIRVGRPKKNGNAARLLLRDVGITKRQSADWQKLAEIPEAEFAALLADAGDNPRLRSTGALIRRWHGEKARRIASLERMAAEVREAGWTVFPPGAE
jgi:hypothetical protein